ncbi:glycosyl hydrolase family 2 [Stackebrandtia albiflava]|uniref:Glycosyl hydrolase family 2 n=1 Tax=Stackebrandtia albiflava TaxID=406432 RepID=A0A562URC6_9ACTN|nr:sugar-binding domain-containing protein [Stackebrandtia albiflava]TWJ08169.1 glycosyl hydrolase family 2 [Stackebrandtia albiflava]
MELLTEWGRDLDPESVLPEYPRPQLRRDSYLNLNGRWDYAIRPVGEPVPAEWDGEILVPFSPEAPLSGVGRRLEPDDLLWYRRNVTLPAGFQAPGGRVLLHFGAVDQSCRVFLNGHQVGAHIGGYLPFHCDITEELRDGDNELVVAVRDVTDTGFHAVGKQRLERGGIWYTAQSGIWQTVWLESVPVQHVAALTLTPDLDRSGVLVTVHADIAGDAEVTVLDGGRPVAASTVPTGAPTLLRIPDPRLWTPEDPHLYDVVVELADDRVESYTGMRSFGVGPDAFGTPRLLLNGEPYFHAGLLDQGYWPDGLYTPPSDDAMVYDIATMKRLGFTMLRKHIKIEPLRWYHHCDRLGMLVWQDMVNGGGPYTPPAAHPPSPDHIADDDHPVFGRADVDGRDEFMTELERTVRLLDSVVGLAVWVPFNEGWGQFDAARVAARVRELDPTRLVDHASGWHDQGAGDIRSVHTYITAFEVPADRDDRVLCLTEYGGYSLAAPGHVWGDDGFGYREYPDRDALAEAFTALHTDQILPAIPHGLSATVYTQVTDVEDELNGLLTYDRAVLKIPAEVVRETTRRLRLE